MVRQELVTTFNTIINGKVYFFLRKSLLRYIVLTLILGFLRPINGISPILTAIIYFIGVNLILWPLQYISARIMAKKMNFHAVVDFSEHVIQVEHLNKDLIETKDWSWIKKIDISKERIWLTINQLRPLIISIPTSKLTASQVEFFETKKK